MRSRAALAAVLVLSAVGCGDMVDPQPVSTGDAAVAYVRPVVEQHETTSTTQPPTTTTHPPSTTSTAPEPTTTTTTQPIARAAPPPSGSCAGWAELIAEHFPPDQVGTACRVMLCETAGTGSPTIHNARSSASGLWQFLDSTWRSVTGLDPPAAAHPPGVQTAAAAALWRSSGWSPWSCY